jgi:hypothetical protein
MKGKLIAIVIMASGMAIASCSGTPQPTKVVNKQEVKK